MKIFLHCCIQVSEIQSMSGSSRMGVRTLGIVVGSRSACGILEWNERI